MSGAGTEPSDGAVHQHGLSREDILRTATTCFARNGYRGTNLGDVAAELGVTRQAIYHYFRSKHEVLLSLFNQFFDALDEVSLKAQEEFSDPAERFEHMYRAHLIEVARVPELSSIFTKEHVSLEPIARDRVQVRRREYHQRFLVAYESAQEAGAFKPGPAGPSVSLMLGAANWIFRWYREARSPLSPEELGDLALSLFSHGYRQGKD